MHRLLLAFALLLLWPACASASTLNCKSGHTVFRQGGARIFSIVEKYERGDLHKLYLCSATVRRPREFDDDYDVDERFDHWGASGRYVGFVGTWEDGTDAGWDAQWVDLATGELRVTSGNDSDGHGLDEFGDGRAVAVDGDGSMAVLEAGQQHKAVIGWAQNGVYRLHHMQTVTSLDVPVVPSSLTFDNGVVSWKTVAGVQGSARVR